MACKYFDDDIAVFHGIFRGLRVRNLRAGTVITPRLDIMSQTLRAWSAIPRYRTSGRRARKMAEWMLFRDCGRLTVDPDDARAITMILLSPEALARHYIREGEIAAVSAAFQE